MHSTAFPPAGLQLLRSLCRHNTPAWIAAHREEYESFVRGPMLALAERLNGRLVRFAPEYVTPAPIAVVQPQRDTRFSRDKAPYRTDAGLRFRPRIDGRSVGAGFSLRIAPEGIGVMSGIFGPTTAQLTTLRRWIARHHSTMRAVLTHRDPRLTGSLQGNVHPEMPPGFAPDHPAANLLRRGQFYLVRPLPVTALGRRTFVREIGETFRAMTPFVRCLNRALLGEEHSVPSRRMPLPSRAGQRARGGWATTSRDCRS
jgi:uncharacterized protein (TIGR02453 family)